MSIYRDAAGALGVGKGNMTGYGNIKAAEYRLDATITTAGTTGAAAINKGGVAVNSAAGAASLVVTNSLVSTSTMMLCTVQTNDSTMTSLAVAVAAAR